MNSKTIMTMTLTNHGYRDTKLDNGKHEGLNTHNKSVRIRLLLVTNNQVVFACQT